MDILMLLKFYIYILGIFVAEKTFDDIVLI